MNHNYIIGSGGLAREAKDICNETKTYAIKYLDEDVNNVDDINVFLLYSSSNALKFCKAIIGIGDPQIRHRIYENYNLENKLFNIKSIYSSVSDTATIKQGCVIFPGSVINSHAELGINSVIYQHSSVSHDSKLGSHCMVCPGVSIAGNVTIGDRCFLGIGSTISNKINICNDVIIGAGACVVRNITEPGTYVGTPARKLK